MNNQDIIMQLQALQVETEKRAAEITGLKPKVAITVYTNSLDKDNLAAERRFNLASEAAQQEWIIDQGISDTDVCWVKDPSDRLTIFIDAEQYGKLIYARTMEATKAATP